MVRWISRSPPEDESYLKDERNIVGRGGRRERGKERRREQRREGQQEHVSLKFGKCLRPTTGGTR
jgi:hypothetical protein